LASKVVNQLGGFTPTILKIVDFIKYIYYIDNESKNPLKLC